MTAMTYTKNIRSEQGENYMTSQHWSFDDSTQTNKSQTYTVFLGHKHTEAPHRTTFPPLEDWRTPCCCKENPNTSAIVEPKCFSSNVGSWDAASARIVPNQEMHLTKVVSGRKRSSLFSISRPGSQGTSKAPGTGELMTVDLQGSTGITQENLTTQESTLQIIHL